MNYKDFINKNFTYAVVGATIDTSKYGHRVFADLQYAGFKVIPINPKYTEVLGVKCYPALKDLPEKPDVVVSIVPPAVGLEIIKQCAELKIDKIWFQPGAESEEVIKLAEELGLKTIHHACIMVMRRELGF